MGRFIPGCGRVGDGPERGSTRIERVFREEAMRGTKAVLALCQCSEASGSVGTITVRGSDLMFGTRA